MGNLAHVEQRKEKEKDFYRLDLIGVRLMSISDGGMTVQNGSKASLVAVVQDSKTLIQYFSNIMVQSNNRGLRYSPKGKMVCFTIRVDYVFLMRAI